MKADSLNAKDLFEKNVRYVVPTFQRPYVWNQEDQWEPLWLDVENAAERYLEALEEHTHNRAEAESVAGSHFLGAVVVQQELTGSSEIETRNVIDGQQRLTTMQLLIDAAQQVAEDLGYDEVSEGLSDLVLNNRRYARRDPDHVFKLWPTSTDRDAFRAAMANGEDASQFSSSQIVKAHDYFRLRIADWVQKVEDRGVRLDRVHALETALLGLLQLVVIDLGPNDDAFVIFETLNARGTPLLASDLVKNYLMQSAAGAGISPEVLHDRYWVQFERDDWWRRDVRQGRIIRPRIDTFLDYWLELRMGEEVPSHAVFPAFRAYVEADDLGLESIALDLKDVSSTYRQLDQTDPWSPEGTFLYRWRTIDAGVTTPVLLWLFSQSPEDLGEERRIRCLRALESYLVRRMTGRMTTKNYNIFFLELVKRLVEHGPSKADEVMVGFLADQKADARLWPSDSDFRAFLLELPLYRLLTRGRLRLILEALEDALRGPKTEDEHVTRGRLTIEHVLPQGWRARWAPPAGPDPTRAEIDRDRLLHTLGNLTLVTSSMNPALSNAPWEEKRQTMQDFTVLLLNKRLLDHWRETWSEEEIRERGEEMARLAIKVWPHAQDL